MNNVLFYKDNPDEFCRLLEDGRFPYLDPVSFKLLSHFYQAYFGNDCQNLTFAITENDQASVIVPCQKFGKQLHNNGAPIAMHYAAGAQTRQKTQAVLETLTSLIETTGVENASLRTTPIDGKLDLLGARFLKAGAAASPLFVSQIDLQEDVTTIRQGIRKSYSPLINWGAKNMTLKILDSENLDKDIFDQVHQFHIHVAGRITRPEETWQATYDLIKTGCAEFIIGYLDNKMVSASLFIDEGHKTTYGVGIYERTLFDKPLAHYGTYQGILRAKQRGQTLFFMGDIATKSESGDKLYQIGEFKKGFCPALTIETQWRLGHSDKGED